MGKWAPQALPVSGLMLDGPVEPWQPPRLFRLTTKKRLVSMALPGPMQASHQPGTRSSSPPAITAKMTASPAGGMVAGQRMANQHRVAGAGVQLPVGFIDQFIFRQAPPARQGQGLGKYVALRRDQADGISGESGH